MEDQRDLVVQRIRDSLPEFLERNKIKARLTEEAMDNLASWVANGFPPLVYRRPCQGYGVEGYACACPGFCSAYRSVSAEDWAAAESADPVQRRTPRLITYGFEPEAR